MNELSKDQINNQTCLFISSSDIRRRIELIQDFEMPGVSTSVRISPDGQYVLSTGIYKPRVRCYETDNLSMKFERCFDSEVVTFEILSDDYSKWLSERKRRKLLKSNVDIRRRIELIQDFEMPANKWKTLEIFSPIFYSSGSELNSIAINPVHQLICVGTIEGKVEAWDPRMKVKAGTLDCAFNCISNERDTVLEGFPSISSLNFNGPLTLGVGTHTGQILLYDILNFIKQINRERRRNEKLEAEQENNPDENGDEEEGEEDDNDMDKINRREQMQDRTEQGEKKLKKKNLGPAPKWCGFLDNLTEELEENIIENVYDDYKFVTRQELEDLGLGHLIGTSLLRAYMHGFFMDIRLYRKAKSVSAPFEFEEFKKKKIRERIEQERTRGVQLNKLPKVNQELALKLMDEKQKAEETESRKKKKKLQLSANLLEDDRFSKLFENPDFQVDTNAEEYRLLNPVLTRLDKHRQKQLRKQMAAQELRQDKEEKEGKASSDESSEEEEEDEEEEESSDDDQAWTKEIKKTYKQINRERRRNEKLEAEQENNPDENGEEEEGEEDDNDMDTINRREQMQDRTEQGEKKLKKKKLSLEERLAEGFSRRQDKEKWSMKHHADRKSLMRPPPTKLARSKFYAGPGTTQQNRFKKKANFKRKA
ncbi:nucleolar protein 10-like [Diaphorina citri]|uniref:Nucleolar protein 10-like n=1 Tax=Diaphorina citri TaxID=121845 RepID=A0A3Q0J4F4_DIACI|nr:nucleolar protein 10-like [Diaphorina citri]